MKIPGAIPNNSIPITVQAIGVWVAPEKTATNPIPAKRAIGIGITVDNALPKVAPTKNRGVTSPPLKPAPSVKPVNKILRRKSYHWFGFEKESTITGTPNPENFVNPKPAIAIAKTTPPITGRSGGYLIFFEKSEPQKCVLLENNKAANPDKTPTISVKIILFKLSSGTIGML